MNGSTHATASTSRRSEPTPVVPDGRAGWWHDYVCPAHGTELLATAHQPSGDHRCPHGCRLVGQPYDAAWRVLEHQRLARLLRGRARRWARTGDRNDRAVAVALLARYGDLYSSALEAGWSETARGWMLRGKLFQQALTEALWGVSVADGVCALVAGDTAAGLPIQDLSFVSPMLVGLVETVDEARRVLVEERDDLRNNYTAWLDCAAVTARRALAALNREGDGVSPASSGPERVARHAQAATSPDGWEWEGATYYHYFVLRAYLITLSGEQPAKLPDDVLDPVCAMLRVLVDLATDDGAIPVLHDGPYSRREALLEIVEVCVLGRQLVDLPGLAALEDGARSRLDDEAPQSSDVEVVDELSGWFAGPPVAAPELLSRPRRSVAFEQVGVLVLRPPGGGWQAVVDAGPHGGSHGHLDKLSLYLYGRGEKWQPAPGVPPYGSALRDRHYRTTAAHPTLRVDGGDQAETTGRILQWEVTANGAAAVVAADQAFPGTRFRRHLRMDGDVLLDAVQVTAPEPRRLTLALRPAVPLEVVLTGAAGEAATRWGDGRAGGLRGRHVCTARSIFACVPVRGPSDDPSRPFPGVDWEAESDRAWFVSLYSPSATSSGEAALTVELRESDTGLDVACSLDGRRFHYRVDGRDEPDAPLLLDEDIR